jgi:hypothetical protein
MVFDTIILRGRDGCACVSPLEQDARKTRSKGNASIEDIAAKVSFATDPNLTFRSDVRPKEVFRNTA